MDWDSVTIHNAVLSGHYIGWFPPAFTFLWKLTNATGNPGTIWILQTLLLLSGMFLLSYFLLTLGRPLTAVALSIVVISPPFVYSFHEMSKDTFMSAALVALGGTSAWLLLDIRARSVMLVGLILCITMLTIIPRFNASFATLPLLCLAFYAVAKNDWRRGVQYAVVVIVSLTVVASGFFRLGLQLPSPPQILTLLIAFDLAGIAKNGGEVPFVVEQGNDVESVVKCYSPVTADELGRENCGGLPKAVSDAYNAAPLRTTLRWIGAIARNPLEYLNHRIANFLFLLRVACHSSGSLQNSVADYYCEDTGISIYDKDIPQIPVESSPRKHVAALLYDRISKVFFTALQPWMAVSLALVGLIYSSISLLRTYGNQIHKLNLALTTSVLLYLSSFAVFGVATNFRYLFWIYTGTSISIVLVLSELFAKLMQLRKCQGRC
jgi:hypothetical protein